MKIYTDGATKGHNGKLGTVSEVGLGVYIPDLGVNHSRKAKGISNNEAEFMALIDALEICIEKGVKIAEFFLDSMIVVNRANGSKPKKKKYQNERMDKFQDAVLEKLEHFDSVSFSWIPREQNEKADELSKLCLK